MQRIRTAIEPQKSPAPASGSIVPQLKAAVLGTLVRHEGRRYADIQRNLPEVPPVTLTRLLRELEVEGLVVRVHVTGPQPRVEFVAR